MKSKISLITMSIELGGRYRATITFEKMPTFNRAGNSFRGTEIQKIYSSIISRSKTTIVAPSITQIVSSTEETPYI